MRPLALPRWCRVVTTGLAFAIFGGMCLVGAGALFPLARLSARDRERGELRVQRWIQWCFRLFTRVLAVLDVAHVEIEGRERLAAPGPAIVVANHPSLVDVVLLVACLPQADCVVKKEAWSNPFLRGVVASAGYVPNDEGEAVVAACVERLRRGRRVVLFPEGTRSPAGSLGRFRRGAAHLALASDVPLLPVSISCRPPMLMRGVPWYRVPERSGRFVLRVEEPLPPEAGGGPGEARALAARRLTAQLRELFEKRLGYAGPEDGA